MWLSTPFFAFHRSTDNGLGSFLKIQCKNTICQHLNTIPTGKRHGKIGDANTKLATGMMHSGIGPSQVNALLSSLNIPKVPERCETGKMNWEESWRKLQMTLKEAAFMRKFRQL